MMLNQVLQMVMLPSNVGMVGWWLDECGNVGMVLDGLVVGWDGGWMNAAMLGWWLDECSESEINWCGVRTPIRGGRF